ncbi:MAG: hypothetical protein DRN81_05605 [Thermoproteota archaeon]|nr:MAG: hypothetical protein DRN81_05605 [Candidatus Korarchaeota archaeon]
MTTAQAHYGWRYYDPETGRFTTPDKRLSLKDPRSLNLYTYCQDNPIKYVDSWGLSRLDAGVWILVDLKTGETIILFSESIIRLITRILLGAFLMALSIIVLYCFSGVLGRLTLDPFFIAPGFPRLLECLAKPLEYWLHTAEECSNGWLEL